jgi:hypothetical protein
MSERANGLWHWGALLLASCLLSNVGMAAEGAAPRKLGNIVKDLKRAETDTYEIFNALNSNDEFDFVCYSFSETGSKVRQRTCEPQFMRTARKKEADRFMQGRVQGTDRAVPMVEASMHLGSESDMAALQQELRQLMQQNPELKAKVEQMEALSTEYGAHPRAQRDEPSLGFLARYMLRNAVR